MPGASTPFAQNFARFALKKFVNTPIIYEKNATFAG
jgi:hypothetical protein